MIVVDASALVDLLLGQPWAVQAVGRHSADADHEPLCAPDLIYLETLNTLRRFVSRDLVSESRANDAVRDLQRTRVSTYPHGPLVAAIWQLRHNLTAYDASYLALAELLDDSILLTADAGLAQIARRQLGDSGVRLISE